MLFFGYIVTETKPKGLQDDIVKVVNSINECVKNIPRLIIGLDNAKKYAKDNGWDFDILEHTFPNNDMWTFKNVEKREVYEEVLVKFKKKIVELQGSNINYHYINIYALKYSKVKALYNILFNNSLSRDYNYIIVDNHMLYLALNEVDVIGVSFSHLDYIGIDKEKVINKLIAEKHNKLYFTTSKNMWKLKDWFMGREYVIASIFENNAKKHTS